MHLGDRGHRAAGAQALARRTLELHRRTPLVTRQDDRRGLPRQGREGTVRCHFTIGAANIEVFEILRHLAELLVRLEVDPLGAAPIEEIVDVGTRSEEHTSELQSLMRNSYAVFCLKKKK